MSPEPSIPPLPTPNLDSQDVFRISPLIRFTLLSLYLALTLPLPFLMQVNGAGNSRWWLVAGLVLGAVALQAALSEQVIVDRETIQVTYPAWVPKVFRRGWCLPWSSIKALKPRSTGQGGLVYYFLSQEGQAYLLPMRVVGFNRLVRRVRAQTGINTEDVRPLAQPWMYLILLTFTILLLLVDGWTIWTASTGHF